MYCLTDNPESTKNNIGSYNKKSILSEQDIDRLDKFSQSIKLEKAGVSKENSFYNIDYEIRNTSIFWVHPEIESEQIRNIFKKICSEIIEINKIFFQFNITDIEPIQYSRYYMGDFYKKHTDVDDKLLAANACRKLSFSIQLTDPSEYEGGDLLFYVGETPTTACKEKGSITVFPSFLLHEVKPVTQGVRNALVGWCWGPKFI